MKRVVLIKSKAKTKGGLEKVFSRIASRFISKGAELTVLTDDKLGDDRPDLNIRIAPLSPISWPPSLRLAQFDRQIRSFLAKHPADIIFGMDRSRNQTHYRAGNGVHSAFLESRRRSEGALKYAACLCNPMHRSILNLEKDLFESQGLRKIFTNSNMVKNQILERFSIDASKIQTIHNGVEWKEFAAPFHVWAQKKEELCRSFQLDPNSFFFLFIGNGYLRKGLLELFKALSKIKERNFTCLVVGKDRHVERYRRAAANLALQDKIRFFGPRQDVISFYQIADVLCIPSFYDPFANVTVEALAMGLYVLSSQDNGGKEILTPGANGEILPNIQDPDSFAQYLLEVTKHPKTLQSAPAIRESVRHLDDAHALDRLIEACYG